jgi:hypothetical protein
VFLSLVFDCDSSKFYSLFLYTQRLVLISESLESFSDMFIIFCDLFCFDSLCLYDMGTIQS